MPSLCFTGFSKKDTIEMTHRLKSLGQSDWHISHESEADLVVIDMDSMSGYMCWMSAQDAKQLSLGITEGTRSNADYYLHKSYEDVDFKVVLEKIAASFNSPQPTIVAELQINAAELQVNVDVVEIQLNDTVAIINNTQIPAAKPSAHISFTAHTEKHKSTALHGARRLADWMHSETLQGMLRIRTNLLPEITIDSRNDCFYSKATLDELFPFGTTMIRHDQIYLLTETESKEIDRTNSQPLTRLAWLIGYSSGDGMLLPGFKLEERFQLKRWPSIERLFPNHFKIATVLLKSMVDVSELSEITETNKAEVANFINAGICSGWFNTKSGQSTGDLLRQMRSLHSHGS